MDLQFFINLATRILWGLPAVVASLAGMVVLGTYLFKERQLGRPWLFFLLLFVFVVNSLPQWFWGVKGDDSFGASLREWTQWVLGISPIFAIWLETLRPVLPPPGEMRAEVFWRTIRTIIYPRSQMMIFAISLTFLPAFLVYDQEKVGFSLAVNAGVGLLFCFLFMPRKKNRNRPSSVSA
ncbi:hypothetical protein [Puniceicoccus vermicola]|uniref:Uncharacterized protein n=1 Tax=Puniceicoccus vermicola TaxID=388746 RepID=A0A7X1B0R7_9BACT|nr:hypothetical protein [Puniceicoccus vermicola]MBC2602355.1 hypothetical protein [Puniceicoccus vermicola]